MTVQRSDPQPGRPGRAPTGTAEAAVAIVATLDRRTKVRLLSGAGWYEVEGLAEEGLAPVAVADGPHGLRHQARDGDHLGMGGSVPATCFPTAATLGSTWDVRLVEEVGAALGAEAVALGVGVVLGPGLNIKRHPAGGRCFEYLSEDPLLGGKLAAAMVRGIQSQGVGACLKHFAVNNQESHRFVVDAVVDERTMRELYLTGFEIAVKESAPWAVMSAYNLVNGTYASEHPELLGQVLRDEWGFEGLVMSDWGAVNDRVAAVRAGLDLEMPSSGGAFDADVLAALDAGTLGEDEVDRCATRVVELLLRTRRHRRPSDHDAHHRLGRRAAAAGSVLLANDGVLPLAPGLARLAVVGAFAEAPRFQGAGSSQVRPTRVDRLLDLVRERVGPGTTVAYAPGYDPATGATSQALLQEALAAADGADVVVFHGGLPAHLESEGFDRASLDLPGDQVVLIEALAARGAPVVVVLSNGGVVHLPWSGRVAAVLECWLGGQAGAGGIVDVLFGDADPGGRLAESIPEHVAQLPADRNFPGRPRQVEYREGLAVGYRFHDTAGVPARFPFGHGLSYTTFEWTDAALEGAGTDVTVTVRVANTGDRPGSDVVQVYVRDRDASVPRPDKELKGFAKVHLEPGASEVVAIPLDRRAFAVWDTAADAWLVESGTFDVVVARSSADPVAELAHHVDSPDEVAPVPGPAGAVMTDEELADLLGCEVPEPPPARPFTRNSTMEDVEATRLGRKVATAVQRVAMRGAARQLDDPDAAMLGMFGSLLREGPARGLVLFSSGKISFAMLDAALAVCNGERPRVVRAIRTAVRARRQRG